MMHDKRESPKVDADEKSEKYAAESFGLIKASVYHQLVETDYENLVVRVLWLVDSGSARKSCESLVSQNRNNASPQQQQFGRSKPLQLE